MKTFIILASFLMGCEAYAAGTTDPFEPQPCGYPVPTPTPTPPYEPAPTPVPAPPAPVYDYACSYKASIKGVASFPTNGEAWRWCEAFTEALGTGKCAVVKKGEGSYRRFEATLLLDRTIKVVGHAGYPEARVGLFKVYAEFLEKNGLTTSAFTHSGSFDKCWE